MFSGSGFTVILKTRYFKYVTDDFYEGDEIVCPRRFVSRCAVLKPYSNSPFKFIVELPV